ncbi:hypothetical protein [Streptomyces sp. NPDC006638]|uniref:DUF7296 family protein n=1 Tax=Streptomyces sp. NPDC006638 TaxID=3157183 RepID=UPI0033AD0C10
MFFTYNQNNSGGGFDFDEARGISQYVIVEAADADEADDRAERIGLYFGGAGDCACCGDRWYAASGWDATNVPSIYGEPVESANIDTKWMGENPDAFVHYADGRVVAHHPPVKKF